MNIPTEKYNESQLRLPGEGKYLIGHQSGSDIVVYQAYKPAIADFAVRHQCLGGSSFSYDRMG